MFDYNVILDYLEKIDTENIFTDLSKPDKEKAIFAASEKLKDYFPIDKISIRAIALQALYSIEGEAEEYAKLKRHGVKQYSVKGVSVTFEGSGISEDVLKLIADPASAKVKRLI